MDEKETRAAQVDVRPAGRNRCRSIDGRNTRYPGERVSTANGDELDPSQKRQFEGDVLEPQSTIMSAVHEAVGSPGCYLTYADSMHAARFIATADTNRAVDRKNGTKTDACGHRMEAHREQFPPGRTGAWAYPVVTPPAIARSPRGPPRGPRPAALGRQAARQPGPEPIESYRLTDPKIRIYSLTPGRLTFR